MPFVKGQSGNPTGRPKGAAGLAREIMERTRDGAEVVEVLLDLLRSPGARPADRLKAAELLLDRGVGRAIATTVTHRVPSLPAGWQTMTPIERGAYLDQLALAPGEP